MKKYWELAELENEVYLRRPFWIFKSAILNFFFASSHRKMQPVYMRYHFFLHYGWFFQNLGKEAVRTFMHTTVYWKKRQAKVVSFLTRDTCTTKNVASCSRVTMESHTWLGRLCSYLQPACLLVAGRVEKNWHYKVHEILSKCNYV